MYPLPADIIAELVSLGSSAAVLAAYAAWLRARQRRDPMFTIQAYHQHVRQRWVRMVMSEPGQALLAVQTLRNSTMGATFLASTVLLLLGATISLFGRPDALGQLWPDLELAASRHPLVWNAKVLALVADIFVAVYAFVMAVRLYAHLSYQVALRPDDTPKGVSFARVAGMLNRAAGLFSLGLRACYMAMPLVFWLFGPGPLFVSTLALVGVMSRLDRNRVAGEGRD